MNLFLRNRLNDWTQNIYNRHKLMFTAIPDMCQIFHLFGSWFCQGMWWHKCPTDIALEIRSCSRRKGKGRVGLALGLYKSWRSPDFIRRSFSEGWLTPRDYHRPDELNANNDCPPGQWLIENSLGHHIQLPPPTWKTCPVIQSACLEARKITALAISSGFPTLLNG